jgi:hypothetical protein
MGFLAILGLLLGWDVKLDSGSIWERGMGSKGKILRNGGRLRYFFILLLRPSTTFFSNRLYDKVAQELNSWVPRYNGRLPKKGRPINT